MARILIIEDEPLISSFFVSLLRADQHQAIAADTGDEGLCLLGQHPADLVVVDLLLPGMDGFQVIQKLKEDFPHTRIIAMSGNATVLPRAIELGADGTLEKPISIEDFRTVIGQFLPK